jgi:DNA transformation protein
MVASDGFAEFLQEQLAPLGGITLRRMFGKSGVFCDGLMLGMVTENTLYFRVDDENRAICKEAESAPPLNYRKRGTTIDLAFWRVPERLFDEPDELIIWGRAALAAAHRVAAKRQPAAPRQKPRPRRTKPAAKRSRA